MHSQHRANLPTDFKTVTCTDSHTCTDRQAEARAEMIVRGWFPVDLNGQDGAFATLGLRPGTTREDVDISGPANATLQWVDLPSGWRLEPHPDSVLFSTLLDDQGRGRASIFYDVNANEANACIVGRYYVLSEPIGIDTKVIDRATGEVVFRAGTGVTLHEQFQTAWDWVHEHHPIVGTTVEELAKNFAAQWEQK